jgi:hypothetical protein
MNAVRIISFGLVGAALGGVLTPLVWGTYLDWISRLDPNWTLGIVSLLRDGAILGASHGIASGLWRSNATVNARVAFVISGGMVLTYGLTTRFGFHANGASRLVNNLPILLWSIYLFVRAVDLNRLRAH